MRVGQRGEGNDRSGAKEVEGRGDVVAGLVPVIGELKKTRVGRHLRGEDEEKQPKGMERRRVVENRSARRLLVLGQEELLHGARPDGLKRDLAEGLLVLRKVLPKDVEERFRLLGAEINALLVFDDNVVRRRGMRKTEKKEDVPDADADLYAVGVGFAIVRALGDGKSGLVG